MSKADKIKEHIGWLKVAFAILSAVFVSLVGWTVQHYDRGGIVYISLITIVVVALMIVAINKMAYKKMDELEEL